MIQRRDLRATRVGSQWLILASEVAKVMQAFNEL